MRLTLTRAEECVETHPDDNEEGFALWGNLYLRSWVRFAGGFVQVETGSELQKVERCN